jgi:tetratricopeptide (TPR) repeat protein
VVCLIIIGTEGALTRLRYFCSPYHKDTPLNPIISQLEFVSGFALTDDPAHRLRKLRSLLQVTATPPEEVALLAELLSLPESGLKRQTLSVQRRKELTFEALIRQLERLAERRPILLLFEDLHWSDASTLELLDVTLTRLRNVPSLFVATFRPEFGPPWSGQAGTTILTLSRLDQTEAALLAQQVTLGAILPPPLLGRVLMQADGIPLFIEELTKAVMESRLLADAPPVISVPETLQASLLSRLDRMPTAKQVAQTASVIGREFSYQVLRAVSELSDAALMEGLEQLVASGLVFRRGAPPAATYIFKHALVQDAAYDSLLRGRRTSTHAAIAAVLESDQDIVASRPGLIGHHYAQADMAEPATTYLFRAGEEAGARSAMPEARAHLMRGLAVAGKISDEIERHVRQAKLALGLTNVVTAMHGFGSHEQAWPVSEAVRLCRALDPTHREAPELLARALFGDWTYKLHVGRLMESYGSARDLLAVGRAHSDPEVLTAVVAAYVANCYFLGRLEEGRETFTASVEDSTKAAREDGTIRFGLDSRSLVHAQFSRLLAVLGYPDRAAWQAHLGIEYARERRHLSSIATNLISACMTAWNLLDVRLLEKLSSEAYRLTSEAGFAYWLLRSKGYTGWIAAIHGRLEEGSLLLREAIAGLDQAGIRLYGPDNRAMLADVYTRMGERDAAREVLEEALAMSKETGEAWIQAELYRRLGKASLNNPQVAEEGFQAALDVAKGQSAKLFELRATVDLARLWREQGRTREAHALLKSIYAWFTEGFEMPDLVVARSLLDELAAKA